MLLGRHTCRSCKDVSTGKVAGYLLHMNASAPGNPHGPCTTTRSHLRVRLTCMLFVPTHCWMQVVEVLVSEKHGSFEECISWARFKFQDYYYNRISQVWGYLSSETWLIRFATTGSSSGRSAL